MSERIIAQAEEVGANYVSQTTEDLAVKISQYKEGGLAIKEAHELVLDENGWICFIANEQKEVYQNFKYRFFATTDGYRILRADEQPEEDWLEINVDISQHHGRE